MKDLLKNAWIAILIMSALIAGIYGLKQLDKRPKDPFKGQHLNKNIPYVDYMPNAVGHPEGYYLDDPSDEDISAAE